jgi:hypothetical protein
MEIEATLDDPANDRGRRFGAVSAFVANARQQKTVDGEVLVYTRTRHRSPATGERDDVVRLAGLYERC